jgi:hypothetical protein
MSIGENEENSVHVSLGKYEHLFSNPVNVNVSKTGAISGDIFIWILAVGRVERSFSPTGDLYGRVSTPFFTVGAVSGHLSGNSGNGTFHAVAGNGT